MPSTSQNNVRNAAIVVASLDPAMADQLLEQMEPRQAALVRSLMIQLDEVDPREETAAIEAFFRIGSGPTSASLANADSGVELDLNFSRGDSLNARGDSLGSSNLRSEPSRAVSQTSDTSSDQTLRPSFQCLHVADNEILLPFLLREHPQTAALVLSQLPPSRAAELLGQLSDAMQTDVLKRLSHLDETSPSVLTEVERELESWIDRHLKERKRRQFGLAAVKSIIDAAAPHAQQTFIARLPANSRVQRAAETPAPLPESLVEDVADAEPEIQWLDFDDLLRLDDAGLLAVYRQADPDWVVMALAGAAPAMMTRLKKLLPISEAKALDQAIGNIGPTRLSDVEAAQRSMAEIASRFVARRRQRQAAVSGDLRQLQTAG